MNRLAVFPLAALIAALTSSVHGAAQAASPMGEPAAPAPAARGSVTLADLVAALEHDNPEIAGARRAVDASVAAIAPAGALPDPTLSAGYMNNVAGIPFVPTSNLFAFRQFGVSQDIPYPGKRALQTQIAVSESGAERWTYEATRRRLVAELKSAYYEYVFVNHSLDVVARNKVRLDEFLQIANARYTVGKATQQDVLKAQLEISLLLERQAQLEQQRTSLRAQINGLLYRRADAPLDVALDYGATALTASVDQLQALAGENNPDLNRDARMVDRGEQAVALAKRDMLPDFGVSVTTQQNGGGMPWMYGVDVMVKVPLYWQRKQRPLIAQATAELAGSRHARENTLAQAAAQVADLYAVADTSRRLATLYGDSVLPQARLTLESSLASYQTGTVDFLTVVTNFITVLDYEINYEEQNARFHEALARLEPLVGVTLTN